MVDRQTPDVGRCIEVAVRAIARVTDPRDALIELLSVRDYSPLELLTQVERDTGVEELQIKDALSELIDQGSVELLPNRNLHLSR